MNIHPDGAAISDSNVTVKEFLSEWLAVDAKPQVKPSTLRRYEQIVRIHIVPSLGEKRLLDLSVRDVSRLLALKGEACAPQSCLHIYRVLYRALKVATQWGLVGANVCATVRPPKVPQGEIAVLERGDILRLLASAKGERIYSIVLTAVKTGMRLGELCGLRWRDVDWERETARVAQALVKPGLRPVFSSPKSGRSRLIPLTDDVIAEFGDLKDRQIQERQRRGARYADFDLVFCQANGRPLNPQSVNRNAWMRIKTRAQLQEGVRFHDLRHAFISRALVAGSNPRSVSAIAGHHDPGFTLRRYAHVTLDDTRRTVEQLNDYLNG